MKVQGMWSKFIGVAVTTLLLTLLAGVSQADAWWDDKWQYRKKVAFDATDKGANVKESLTDAPVLVRLHSGNFDFNNASKDGSDLRFVGADDKSPLKSHVEMFDPALGMALVWVKVPRITGAASSDSVWLYYGNDSVSGEQETGGTYDTAQVLVYHFDEKDGVPRDATAYANHGADFNGKLGLPAVIGNGASFSGNGERLVVKQSPSLNFSKGFTFSAWVKPVMAQGDAYLFSLGEGKQAIHVGLKDGGAYAKVGEVSTGKSQPLTPQTWHHLAVAAEPGGKLAIYLNGHEAASVSAPKELPSPAADMVIGGSLAAGNFFAGELDEVELATTARSADWFAAAVAGQGPDGKLTSYLQEEKGGGGGENHTVRLIKVTARSITFDGWAIIFLCTFMLFLAVGVFISKFTKLQKIKKGNEAFLESFNSLHDPLELDQEDDNFQDSSLFRIYQAGYDRVMNWVEKREETEGDVTLPVSAMNIFRAALDRANSEELKKMNAWMIVLTLSISGGPFWGLLGTVWGVMNTFAALAEAGEANLSAIAPGVASALACTLFGLFVAIPALFAYSFLIMHMKNLNVETRHFIEEYALRVEGFHGEEEA